jgi:hypothetical protein
MMVVVELSMVDFWRFSSRNEEKCWCAATGQSARLVRPLSQALQRPWTVAKHLQNLKIVGVYN